MAGVEGGGPERGGGGGAEGVGAVKTILCFGKLRLLFLGKAKMTQAQKAQACLCLEPQGQT